MESCASSVRPAGAPLNVTVSVSTGLPLTGLPLPLAGFAKQVHGTFSLLPFPPRARDTPRVIEACPEVTSASVTRLVSSVQPATALQLVSARNFLLIWRENCCEPILIYNSR
jgi:hypothetical protein